MKTLAVLAAALAITLTFAATASAGSFEKKEKTVSDGVTTCKITKVTVTNDSGDSSERKSKVCKDNFNTGGGGGFTTGGGGGGSGFGGGGQRPQPIISININRVRDLLR
jgi:uncharacterized membrane protein YgcG